MRMLIKLEHLQNLFFVDKLLIRHGHVDDGDLLIRSYELVALALKLWTNKDRFDSIYIRRSFEFVVSRLVTQAKTAFFLAFADINLTRHIGLDVRGAWRRHPLPRAITADLQRRAPQEPTVEPLQYCSAIESTCRIP